MSGLDVDRSHPPRGRGGYRRGGYRRGGYRGNGYRRMWRRAVVEWKGLFQKWRGFNPSPRRQPG